LARDLGNVGDVVLEMLLYRSMGFTFVDNVFVK